MLIPNNALLGNPPLAGDDVEEVRAYISDDEGLHKTAMFFGIVVLPFAIFFFFSGIGHRLRATDREHNEGWAIAAIASAILLGAAAGVGDVLASTLLFREGEGLSDSTIRAISDAQGIAYASTGIAATGLTLSVAIPSVRHGVFPMWHAALGGIEAALGVLAVISIMSATSGASIFGLVAFIGLAVWSLATSVLLIRDGAES